MRTPAFAKRYEISHNRTHNIDIHPEPFGNAVGLLTAPHYAQHQIYMNGSSWQWNVCALAHQCSSTTETVIILTNRWTQNFRFIPHQKQHHSPIVIKCSVLYPSCSACDQMSLVIIKLDTCEFGRSYQNWIKNIRKSFSETWDSRIWKKSIFIELLHRTYDSIFEIETGVKSSELNN